MDNGEESRVRRVRYYTEFGEKEYRDIKWRLDPGLRDDVEMERALKRNAERWAKGESWPTWLWWRIFIPAILILLAVVLLHKVSLPIMFMVLYIILRAAI